MSDAGDRIPRGPYERGLTREELLRRAAVGGVLLTGFGALGAACGGDDDATATGTGTGTGTTDGTGQPKRGGTFRFGTTGGSAKDFIDGQHIVAKPDIARLVATFESLGRFDEEYVAQVDGLAEEITAEARTCGRSACERGSSSTTARPSTADDVIYSFRRL